MPPSPTVVPPPAQPIAATHPCPISPVVEVAFSRWSTAILWLLQSRGALRFSVIRDALGAVTPKVLTARLRQLQRDGLITRTQFAEVPPRVEYEITDLGRSLSPAFELLAQWSAEHLPLVEDARASYDEAGCPLPR